MAMVTKPGAAEEPYEKAGDLLILALLSSFAGGLAGLMGSLFRLALIRADHVRDALLVWAHGQKVGGCLLVTAACAGATAIAAWLVRRFAPPASGSGIPSVEAALDGRVHHTTLGLIPVKFFGGVLAIGSGLALGREGPSVQMGACIAHRLGNICHRNWPDVRVLIAAGAGAGLATAFNAPIAGAVFVLEELVRRFEPRIAMAALGASSSAIFVSRFFLGAGSDFHVQAFAFPSNRVRALFFVLGAVAGLAAVAYNHAILGALAAADKLRRCPVEIRAALIGAAVGMLAWFAPEVVGGGDRITQATLLGVGTLAMLPLLFLLRLGLGAMSYAAATPGGLFAPMLVLGAELGLFFGILCRNLFSGLTIQPEAFALVGMGAFFCGVVRAPLTGIVLVTEMTGNDTLLLPMIGACFMAMLVPALLRNSPIYESLRDRQTAVRRSQD